MPIQFFCPACRQPIEVDDEVANLSVTCPFCRKVITAPAASDPAVRAPLPSARPGAIESSAPIGFPPPPLPRPSMVGYLALGCALVFLCCIAGLLLYSLTLAREIPPNATREEVSKLLRAKMNNPTLQFVSFFGSCVVPVLGTVLAIAALVRKARPRWPAITALIVFGALGLILAGVALLQVATASATAM